MLKTLIKTVMKDTQQNTSKIRKSFFTTGTVLRNIICIGEYCNTI